MSHDDQTDTGNETEYVDSQSTDQKSLDSKSVGTAGSQYGM